MMYAVTQTRSGTVPGMVIKYDQMCEGYKNEYSSTATTSIV